MLKALPLLFFVAVMLAGVSAGQAQDAKAGKVVFKKCAACHQVGPGARAKAGPVLNGVVGRTAGTSEGFPYRKPIIAAGKKGLVWDEETLIAYLADPTKFLRAYLDDKKARSAMPFRLRDEQAARDVIAYIVEATAAAAAAPAPEAGNDSETAAAPTTSVEEVIAAQEFPDAFLADAANIEAGKEIWFAQCTHCHGLKAYPGKAPKLKPAKYTPEFVFKRAYKGFKKMPAWREVYSVDEIRQIVAYVKSPGFSP